MRSWVRKIYITGLYFIACLVILMAVLGVALKELTPVINKHKGVLEQYASDLFGVEVHIHSIQADWERFGPEVHFKGITFSENAHVVVKADDVTMHIGIFKTLWRRALYFRTLSFSGADLSIREISPKHYLLNNVFPIDLSEKTDTHSPDLLAWLVTQNHFFIHHVHLSVTQLNNTKFFVQFERANIYQSSQETSQQQLSIFIDGQIVAETTDQQGKLKCFESDLGLSAWVNFFQQKLKFVEVALLNRNLVFQKEKSINHFSSFEGIFLWQPTKVGNSVHWVLKGKEVRLSKEPRKANDYSFELWKFFDHYTAHLNALNLVDVEIFADFFDLIPEKYRLAQAKMSGSLEDIDVEIPQDFSAIDQYRFSAALHDFSSVPYQGIPEVHHLSGALSGKVSQGNFVLLDQEDNIYFPLYFNQPIAINALAVNGQWSVLENTFSLFLNSVKASAKTVNAQAMMKIDIPLNSSNAIQLSLLGQYQLTQSQDVVKYLPMKAFSSGFSQWLMSAVGTGSGSEGKVLIRGDIDHFPYPNKEGTFIVDGSVKPLEVSFSPEWPVLNNISGRLLLHNQLFSMNILKGESGNGLNLSKASVSVPDYQADDAIINVDIETSGSVAPYLNYIQKTPLNKTLGQWLNPFKLRGNGQLSLHLGLPIAHLDNDHIQVEGQWLAKGMSFAWKGWDETIKNIQGAIHFTQDSFFAKNIKATLEQEPLQLSIETEKEKGVMSAIDVNAHGAFSLAEIKVIAKTDVLSSYLSGRSHFQANLRLPITTSEYLVSLKTDLRGVRVSLPGAFGKQANESAPFSAQLSLNPTTDIAQLILHYTQDINATMNIQHYSQEKTRTFQVDASATTFSWPIAIKSSSTPSSFWSSLTAFTLHFSHLSLYHNDFSSVLLSMTRNTDNFLWKIRANEVQGNMTVPFQAKQPINAYFDYITLKSLTSGKDTESTDNSDLSAKEAATWPPFYVEIQALKAGQLNLGKTILQLTPTINGVKFDKIELQNVYHHILGHGRWVNEGLKDATYLEGEFSTKNLGEFLKGNGITENFQAQQGQVNYNLWWLGSPKNFQLKTLEGNASLDVKNGVIPLSGDAAKNGLGKVLTLFSAQSIQRRLQFNFSDLSENGYSFNTLTSKMHFHLGNAQISKGEFDGPEAKIGFTGRLGLVRQNYDLYLVVTPYVTSSLPLIATLAGGPIAGVATYAFDKIAASSIAKYTSYRYLLRGPWAQPQLISLDLEAEKKPEEKNIAPVEEAR